MRGRSASEVAGSPVGDGRISIGTGAADVAVVAGDLTGVVVGAGAVEVGTGESAPGVAAGAVLAGVVVPGVAVVGETVRTGSESVSGGTRSLRGEEVKFAFVLGAVLAGVKLVLAAGGMYRVPLAGAPPTVPDVDCGATDDCGANVLGAVPAGVAVVGGVDELGR
jgi:hypothetical protein